jgi:putative hemolysin
MNISDNRETFITFSKPTSYTKSGTKEREKMKRTFTLIAILIVLIACTAPQLLALTATTTFQVQKHEATGTDIPPVNMPNPASVYCTQKGNKLEIRTAADGSQNGVCIFPNGSTCDEWAYYRGECSAATPQPGGGGPGGSNNPGGNASGGSMPPGTTEEIADWWGVIKSTPPGAQYDDYFKRQDLGQIIYFGIESLDPALKLQIKALRDSGKTVHLYGTLFSNVPDYNGSQIQVNRIEVKG